MLSVTADKFIGNFKKRCKVSAKRNFKFRRSNQTKQMAHADGVLEIARQLLVPKGAKATEDGGALNEKGQ